MHKLTVLIPTYNRKNDLAATLKALSEQDNDDFDVLISDNHSNYSIEEEIFPDLPEKFLSRVSVHHQPFNVGGINITGLLMLCKSEWGWLLGDDDFVQPNAISNIYKTFRKYPDVDGFWFSVIEEFRGDTILNNMEELQELLQKRENLPNNNGDFFFCSNKVYRIQALVNMYNVFRFSYNAMGHTIPIFEMLKAGKKVGAIGFDDVLVKHGGQLTWDVSPTATGMRTLFDYPTGLSWKRHCRFVRSVMFNPDFVFRQYLKLDHLPWNYRAYLKNIYSSCYRFCYPWYKRVFIKPLFWFASCSFGWKVLRSIFLPIAAAKDKIRLKLEPHPVLFKYAKAVKRTIMP